MVGIASCKLSLHRLGSHGYLGGWSGSLPTSASGHGACVSATHFTGPEFYTVGKSCKQTLPDSFVVQARSAHSRKSTEIKQTMDGQVRGVGGWIARGVGIARHGGGWNG